MCFSLVPKEKKIFNSKGFCHFTEKEFKLVMLIANSMKNNSEVILSDDVLNQVWGQRLCVISQNTASQLAHRVRIKFNELSIPVIFKLSVANGLTVQKTSKSIFIISNNKCFINTMKWIYKIYNKLNGGWVIKTPENNL